MQPLIRGELIRPPVKYWIRDCIKHGLSRKEAKARYKEFEGQEVWLNDRYVVIVYRKPYLPGYMNPQNIDDLIWLSLRRQDRKPLFDWRDIQLVKNQLLGAECEMVQVFPSESRLVDSANQYHFFGFTTPGKQFPFGFPYREVSHTDFVNSQQRAFTHENI